MPRLRTDAELLAAFRRGDRRALTDVYWAYVGRVETIVTHGYVLTSKGTRVAGAGREAIADLVQETFARAFRESARLAYDGVRDYGPYLSTIARNVLTDWARKHGREVPTEDFSWLDDRAVVEEPPAIEPWADEETVRVVEAYLASLDDDLRAVHRERYERGLSQERAAEVLGITRQQLRTREARLREGLARRLAESTRR